MNTPDNCQYTPEHEWVVATESGVRIGITDFAQRQLGDVVYVSLPAVGQLLTAGQPCGEVESTKSVSDIIAPVSGMVRARNEALIDDPGAVNSDPYGAGWMVDIDMVEPGMSVLLTAAQYRELIGEPT